MDKRNIAIDVVALVVYAVAANPAFTGINVHEWLSLGVVVVLFVHFALHIDWVMAAVRGIAKNPTPARVGMSLLDAAILVALAVVAVSGVFVSGSVLLSLGYYAQGYYFWDPLHAISAKVLLALIFVHVVVHGKKIVRFFAKRTQEDA